jgi:hypothetical protein
MIWNAPGGAQRFAALRLHRQRIERGGVDLARDDGDLILGEAVALHHRSCGIDRWRDDAIALCQRG